MPGGRTPRRWPRWPKGRLRRKLPELEEALTSLMREHHRQLLAMQLAHIDFLDEQIDALSNEIARRLLALSPGDSSTPSADVAGKAEAAADPDAPALMTFARAVSMLDTIPGVNQRGGEMLVAEWGIDMARFGTADRLAAWSGVAPGNDESAGKRRSGKTRKGNRTLPTGLTQLAHAAARTKDTYLSALYQRLAARRGKKRAIMAVAHSIVVSAFHMLSRTEPYQELGANYFGAHRREHFVDHLTRRIERLSYRVSLEPVPAA